MKYFIFTKTKTNKTLSKKLITTSLFILLFVSAFAQQPTMKRIDTNFYNNNSQKTLKNCHKKVLLAKNNVFLAKTPKHTNSVNTSITAKLKKQICPKSSV